MQTMRNCRNCGAPLTDKHICEYCGTIYEEIESAPRVRAILYANNKIVDVIYEEEKDADIHGRG